MGSYKRACNQKSFNHGQLLIPESEIKLETKEEGGYKKHLNNY